jgi:RNA polymerase sigma-70 factor (ECF subfamily)
MIRQPRIVEPINGSRRPLFNDMQRSSETVLDELLVLDAQTGNDAALTVLVQRWHSRLYRHAFHLIGRHDAAADIVQESWLAVARTVRRLEDPACFPRWVFQIVSRKSADWIRQQTRQRKLVKEVGTQQLALPVSTHHEASETDVDQLPQALHKLPDDRRELLSMYYQADLSVADISHILTIPVGTVKSRLHHARQELKLLLERNKL